ncbi:MAG TPA: hypothetical protein VJT54_10765 [Verrucomicrobiae bacterium]|nr:hypothetical protein [Verrucomicrobiae bacterium]
MNNPLFRTLIIFGACIVLAVWLGFLLVGPLTYSSMAVYGALAFILAFPLLLRWHYPLLLLSWYMTVSVFFLPGSPSIALLMIVLSLGISILQRMISTQSQFIHVPQITLPLLLMLGVIAVTAKLTGFGLRVFGSGIYGAAKYFYLVGGVLGYFALSAKKIPPERKNLYIGLFFLGGVVGIVGDFLPFLPRSLYFIYWVFKPNTNFLVSGRIDSGDTRLVGTWLMSMAVVSYMLARYGIRGMFLSGKPWRWILFLLFAVAGMLGGFRGYVILVGFNFMVQFFLEGLYRTKLMAVLVAGGILGALAMIPLSDHLPDTIQRALAFLPYKVDPEVRLEAQGSLDWRLDMWQAILPQVPHYLLLGKGYVLSQRDFSFLVDPNGMFRNSAFAENDALALSEDFHNGPLSVVIPFGIWGCLAFLWFLAAGTWVMYRNYRYSDPALQTVNTGLLAAFLTVTFFFLFVGGFFNNDMLKFCGLVGFSVALNGGVRRRVRVVQPVRETPGPRSFAAMPGSPVPAFQRRQPGLGR